MADTEKQSPLLVCTSCGQPSEPGQHICAECGAPLSPFAFSDPILGIQARGFAAHVATKTQKKIVVIGMWIWMIPMLVVGVGLLGLGGAGVLAAIRGDIWGWFGLPFVGLGGVFVWISVSLIVRTTGSLIAHMRTQQQGAPADFADEENEHDWLTCLDCGEELPPDGETCPHCGWSYADSDR